MSEELSPAQIMDKVVSDMEGDLPGVKSDSPADNPEQNTDQATTATTDEQPKTDDPGEKPAVDQTEGQDEVEQAVKSMEKVLNKKLTDDEAVSELAKSHLLAGPKIESLRNQIKELIPFYQQVEQIKGHPRFAEIQAILENRAPAQTEEQDPDLNPDFIPPSVKALIDDLQNKVKKMESDQNSKTSAAQQEKIANDLKEIKNFADKEGNEDFKKLLYGYWNEWKESPLPEGLKGRSIPIPEMIRKFAVLVNEGFNYDEAWASLNPGKIRERVNTQIAKEQARKVRIPHVDTRPAVKPKPEDMDDMGDVVNALAAEIKTRG